jgi:hypothetical protein
VQRSTFPKVPLIYLDTSHLASLAAVASNDPERYARFKTFWQRAGVQLALSRIHLHELRRHNDLSTRQRRWQLLADLAPIRSDLVLIDDPLTPNTLAAREGLAALVRSGIVRVRGVERSNADVGFPTRLDGNAVMEAAPALDGAMGSVVRGFHAATVLGASAQSDSRRANKSRGRLRDLRLTRVLEVRKREVVQSIARAKGLSKVFPLLLAIGQTAVVLVLLPVSLPTVVAFGALYRRLIDADAADEAEFTDVLLARSLARSAASSVLVRLGLGKVEAKQLATRLDLADFPGAWLRTEAKAKLLAARSTFTAQDDLDLDHLAYAPYVDLFFADRRTREFAHQALRGRDRDPQDRLCERIVSAGSLDEMQDRISLEIDIRRR